MVSKKVYNSLFLACLVFATLLSLTKLFSQVISGICLWYSSLLLSCPLCILWYSSLLLSCLLCILCWYILFSPTQLSTVYTLLIHTLLSYSVVYCVYFADTFICNSRQSQPPSSRNCSWSGYLHKSCWYDLETSSPVSVNSFTHVSLSCGLHVPGSDWEMFQWCCTLGHLGGILFCRASSCSDCDQRLAL